MIDWALRNFAKLCLHLRYRVRLSGLDEIAGKGKSGILFLPNHPALIDPIILLTYLQKDFAVKALADKDQIDRFFIRFLARRVGVRPIPDIAKHGVSSREHIERELTACVELLKAGENVLLYPSGRVYRQYLEDLGGNSAAGRILNEIPDVRIVMVRTRGLWGSAFSWAGGREPDVAKVLKKSVVSLLLGGVFFAPRREVTIEFHEPEDLPRRADRNTLNRFLEAYYNDEAPKNTYVPYTFWDRRSVRQLDEPDVAPSVSKLEAVPESTREIVTEYLKKLADVEKISDEDRLGRDLGLDSLARGELLVFLDHEFGFPQGDVDSLRTVADVMLVACGESVSAAPVELKPVPQKWFTSGSQEQARLPEGETVMDMFLAQARREPGRVVMADQSSGAVTYRDLIAAALLLRPKLQRLGGEKLGIMLPASVAAGVVYMASLFAGKTPVMVNWTVGPRNMAALLELAGAECVVTSERLVGRIASQGSDFGAVGERFIYLERIMAQIPWGAKLCAWVKARTSWRSLRKAKISNVVAVILFTSGSEALPKAVPLTHDNVLGDLRDVVAAVELRQNDRLVGILPPFHSFGLTVGILAPLCLGMSAVYHPNPAEGAAIAKLIEAYKATILVGTPTFLSGIVRASGSGQLDSLRLAVTGAERCHQRVYTALSKRCPNALILEGYGVTECSPIVAINNPQAPKPFTIGKVLPSFEWAIVSPRSGRRVPRGRKGILLLRGPCVFGGYLGSDAPSPFVQMEGKQWYRTGDLVSEDNDGVLTFCGRLKRFTKIGGEMISLPAVEAVLRQHFCEKDEEHPTIAVEATAGEARPELVLFTTLPIDRDEANRQIRQAGLSPLHNIRRVVRMDEIPILGTGKTDYLTLRKVLNNSSDD